MKIIIRAINDKGVQLFDDYTVMYQSVEELGNDGDLAYRLMEKVQEVEAINQQISEPF